MRNNVNRMLGTFFIAVGLMTSIDMAAQCVKISTSEKEGRVYTPIWSYNNEETGWSGYECYDVSELSSAEYGAIWKHNQIPFEMVCVGSNYYPVIYVDEDGCEYIFLDNNGRLKPYFYSESGGDYRYINAFSSTVLKDKGVVVSLPYESDMDETYYNVIGVSLPKGYGFTNYSLKLRLLTDDEATEAGIDDYVSDATISIGRAMKSDEEITTDYVEGYYVDGGNAEEGITLKADVNSLSADVSDADNNLYFVVKLSGGSDDGKVAFVIEDAEFSYKIVPFNVDVNGQKTGNVSGVAATFTTQRYSFDKLYKTENDRYGFDAYNSSDDYELQSNVLLYDGAEVSGGKPTLGSNGSGGKIEDGDSDISLKRGTYYIEAPVAGDINGKDALGENDTSIPLGYRITGATINLSKEKETVGFNIGVDADGEDAYLWYNSYYERNVERQYVLTTISSDDARVRTARFCNDKPQTWYIDDEGYIYTYISVDWGYNTVDHPTRKMYLANTNLSRFTDGSIYYLTTTEDDRLYDGDEVYERKAGEPDTGEANDELIKSKASTYKIDYNNGYILTVIDGKVTIQRIAYLILSTP